MATEVEKIFSYYLNMLEEGKKISWEDYLKKFPTYEKELTEFFQAYLKIIESFFEEFSDFVPDLEQYEIVEKIGEGGMGAVFKAVDTNLGRTVAIKTSLPLEDANELQEARSMAKLQHQNIVQVFDWFKSESKSYIVMELVEGCALDEKIGELTYERIATIFYQLCDAIEYAHENGVIHRDIKLQNILLTSDLKPKIVDFGLAEDLEHIFSKKNKIAKGTPIYTAPEIMKGESSFSTSVDIYSLGICLYVALTGKLPFEFSNIDDLIQKIGRHKFDFPRALNDKIPEGLQAIALKAMDACPENRYINAEKMKEDLKRFIGNEKLSTKPSVYKLHLNELVSAHQKELHEWEKQSLISREEKEDLSANYELLLSKEEDWILENRKISFSQNSLYLGVWLSVIGSAIMFYALFYPHGNLGNIESSIFSPIYIFLTAAICCVTGFIFWNEGKLREGLSFLLAFEYILPFAFLGLFKGFSLFHNPVKMDYELFPDSLWISNLQLFQSFFYTSIVCFFINLKIKTRGTSFAFGINVFISFILCLIVFGLKEKILNTELVWFGWWLLIFSIASFFIAYVDEIKRGIFLAEPFYWLFLISFLGGCNVWAYQGELFQYLGISFDSYYLGSAETKIEVLHQCLSLMLISLFCLLVSNGLKRLNTKLSFRISRVLNFVVPYFLLLPLAYLSKGFDFGFIFDVTHLVASVVILYLSIWLKRKNYFFAGLLNIAAFIFIYGIDYELLEKFSWSRTIVIFGVISLVLGSISFNNKIRKASKIF